MVLSKLFDGNLPFPVSSSSSPPPPFCRSHFTLSFPHRRSLPKRSKLLYLISRLILPILPSYTISLAHFTSFLSPLLSIPESLPRCQGCSNRIFDPFVLKLGHENERHTCWHASKYTLLQSLQFLTFSFIHCQPTEHEQQSHVVRLSCVFRLPVIIDHQVLLEGRETILQG